MRRPKPPPDYVKVKRVGTRHPLRQCPFCGAPAPFFFEESLPAFQDDQALAAYHQFLADDAEWRFLHMVSLACGLDSDTFELLHGSRPRLEQYAVNGRPLHRHWSRYRQGVCDRCRTQIWHDLGRPHHYYYRPSASQLPLLPPDEPDKRGAAVEIPATNEMTFQDLFQGLSY